MPNISNPIIGIDLLKMLMLQLYSNPRCIYREYIQNSLDSINDAVKKGILPRVKDGRVSINITSHDITIEDNGTGISKDNAVKILTDIANSVKDGIDTAGQFGVGRLSGGGYCELLEFETTYVGEDESTIISLDTMKLRKLIEGRETDISAEEAMRQICTTSSASAKIEDHKFIVRLKNIINSREILLNVEEIRNYIAEYAPIDYSVLFNALINSSPQKDFVNRHKQIEKIRVSLNEYTDIEKGYGTTVIGTGDDIDKIRYFELPKHPKYGNLGWGWYAVTDFSVQINDEKDACAGIRLRKHNISLDKNILNTCFREARGNKYFYGEIFITNDKIVPDSGRQGLAAGEETDALVSEIKNYFTGTLHYVYHKANALKNILGKLNEVVSKINNPEYSVALAPLTEKLVSLNKDFRKATNEDKEEIKDVISIFSRKYDNDLKTSIEKILQPKEQETVNEPDILDFIVQPDDDKVSPDPIPPLEPPTGPGDDITIDPPKSPDIPPQKLPKKSPTTQQQVPDKKKQPKSKVDEILATLRDKGYSDEDIMLLKRVFDTMLIVCPSSGKKNLLTCMVSAVNSLN